MFQLLLIISTFIIACVIIYVIPFLESYNFNKNKKLHDESQEIIHIKNAKLVYYNYPRRTLEEIIPLNDGKILIDAQYINIKNHHNLDQIEFINVKKIYNFNVFANEITFIDSNYTCDKYAIIDDQLNLHFIYNKPTKLDLITYSEKYNIKLKALRHFSNALYFQFNKKEKSLRISKPYNVSANSCSLICPSKVEGVTIEKIEINYDLINFLYLASSISFVIYEKNVNLNKVYPLNNHKFFKLRDNKLVYRKYNIFVDKGINIKYFKKNYYSSKYIYKPVYTMSKFDNLSRIELKK